jgi:hypothetical protein
MLVRVGMKMGLKLRFSEHYTVCVPLAKTTMKNIDRDFIVTVRALEGNFTIQCCGSGMFIPDPNFPIPVPG